MADRRHSHPGDAPAGASDDPWDELDDVEAGCREHYADADLYDYEYRRRRDDVRFYQRMAGALVGPSGRILEIACGTGRVTAGLLRAGHTVTGIDISLPMLRRAAARISRLGRAARARSALVCADMRAFSLDTRFPLAVMAFNSFEHLYTRVEVSACLDRVRDHLLPGGRLVFDVQNPDLHWLIRDPRKRWARTRFTHPRTGQRMIYSTNHDYDPVSQIVLIRLFYETAPEDTAPGETAPEDTAPDETAPGEAAPLHGAETRVVTLSQRKFFPAELEALLAANGFAVEARHGDFDGNPLEGDSPNQVIVCKPR